MIEWKIIDSEAKLESIINQSASQPQVIFKHSTTCPISSMAKNRIERDWDLEVSPYYLDLLALRNVSNAIADILNVVHQSPQVIVVKNGLAVYNESHLDINVQEIRKAIAA